MSGYGNGPYGDMPYGDAFVSSIFSLLSLVSVLAIRENQLQLQFNQAVYFSGLGDPNDASNPALFSVSVVPDTVGLDGAAVHPVRAIAVDQPATDPSILILSLDRPMTAFPAAYSVSVTGLLSEDKTQALDPSGSAASFPALFKEIVIPTGDVATPKRDFANPQNLQGASTLPRPSLPKQLGVFGIDDTGDFTTDQGIVAYKKRILRVLVSPPGAYLHLGQDFGVGIPQNVKKTALASRIQSLAAEAEKQIGRDPETAAVKVTGSADPAIPSKILFNIRARTRTGIDVQFGVGFKAP
jgi:hypothetical protein